MRPTYSTIAYAGLASAIIFGGAGMSPAAAQSASAGSGSNGSTGSEVIVVTAQRREQALQDVPLSVTAMSAAALERKGVSGLADLSPGSIPSVIFSPNSGRDAVLQIAIRGLGTNDPAQGTRELPVPLYVDGIYLGRAEGTGLELLEPERIEVLRGPQGTLFGRNAEGGAVQFITKKPTGVLGGDIGGTVGDYDLERVHGRLDLPDFHGFKVEIAGLYAHRGALTKNDPENTLGTGVVEGLPREQADFGVQDQKGVRAAVRYDGTDRLKVDYVFDWSRGKEVQDYLQYSGPTYSGGEPPSSTFVHHSTQASYQEPFVNTVSGHSLTAAYEASDAITLKSLTSLRRMDYGGYTGLAGLDVGPAFGLPDVAGALIYPLSDENLAQHQFSQEVQMLGNWKQLQVTAGAIYYRESITQYQHTGGLAGPGLLLVGLPVDFSPGANYGQGAITHSFGLYIQGTYHPSILDDKLELTAGVRYSRDRKHAVRFQVPADPANPFDPSVTSADLTAAFSANRLDPEFNIKYKFDQNVSVYLRYSQAYRAGGVNIRSLGFEPYDAEVLKEFELGLKAQTPDRKLTFDAALYQNKLHNPQVDVAESLIEQTATTTINAPITTRTLGAEVEATYVTPLRGLTLGANYARMGVRQPAFVSPDEPTAGQVNINKLFAPKNSGSFTGDYRLPVGEQLLLFHADYAYASDFFTTIEITPVGSPLAPQRPLTTHQLNGRIALQDIKVGGTKAELAVWGKNLLNVQDLTYSFTVLGDNAHNFFYITPPRSWGVDLTVRF